VRHACANAARVLRIPTATPLTLPRVAGKGTPATALLGRQRIAHTVHTYVHSDGQAYGSEAAEAMGVEPARVFKTLVAEVDGVLTVGIVPVAGSLDLKALAAAVGGKRAKMAEVADAIDELRARQRELLCAGRRQGLEIRSMARASRISPQTAYGWLDGC